MAHVDMEHLKKYVAKGIITEQKHPVSELLIYNYTPIVQYGKLWDEVTMACRGLIVKPNGRVVAQPFMKFFNYGEYKGALPAGERIISEKLDGSLGICYPHKGVLSIATRGSFVSEQAKEGDKMLQEYIKANGLEWYDERYTYLFEIIYPANRIVVDYKGARRLVLLAVINTNDGTELNPADTGYKDVATRFDGDTPIEDLLLNQKPNQEGYVVRFSNGMRLKFKFDEYVRLHRLLTNVSTKTIWEMLKNEQPIEQILDNVPDEFYEWVREQADKLKADFTDIEFAAQNTLRHVQHLPTRKEVAADVVMQNMPLIRAVVFAMLDGKEYRQIIWKSLRPKYERPFIKDIDC